MLCMVSDDGQSVLVQSFGEVDDDIFAVRLEEVCGSEEWERLPKVQRGGCFFSTGREFVAEYKSSVADTTLTE